jgi:hypothetical protein
LPQTAVEFFYFWNWFRKDNSSSDASEARRLLATTTFNLDPTPTEQELAQGVHSGGYESKDIVENLETLFVVIIVSVMLLLLTPVYIICGRYCKCVKSIKNKIFKMFFWNGIIMFLLEGYLELAVDSFINLKFILKSIREANGFKNIVLDVHDIVSLSFSAIFLLWLLVLPFAITIFLCKKSDDIIVMEHTNHKRFREYNETYGSLYEGIDLRKKSSLFFSSSFILRRLILSYILVFMEELPA